MTEPLSREALIAAGARKIQPNYDSPCERRGKTCVTHDAPRTPASFQNESSVKCSAVRTATRVAGNVIEAIAPLIRADEEERRDAEYTATANAYLDEQERHEACSREVHRLTSELDAAREALEFYADPATYHAIAFWADPPCGDFTEDFSEDHGDPFYDRAMPGKAAREALRLFEPGGGA